jgi:hypothetical protein
MNSRACSHSSGSRSVLFTAVLGCSSLDDVGFSSSSSAQSSSWRPVSLSLSASSGVADDAAFSKDRAAFLRSVLGLCIICQRNPNRTVPHKLYNPKSQRQGLGKGHAYAALQVANFCICPRSPSKTGGFCDSTRNCGGFEPTHNMERGIEGVPEVVVMIGGTSQAAGVQKRELQPSEEGMDENNVLIVGAGPTGLTLACDLRSRGIAVQVIDKAAGPATTSRA